MLSPSLRPLCRRQYRATTLFLFFVSAVVGLLANARPARADAWALLIGIDQYEEGSDIASLGGADNDANALAKTLVETAGFSPDHITTLTSNGDRKPLKRTILHELETLRAHVHRGDTVFVAYSGHGVDSAGVPYLLPFDADISTPSLIRDSSISEEKFREYLQSVPAKALILVFDMCRVNADKSGRTGPAEDAHLLKSQVRALDFSSVVMSSETTTAVAPLPMSHPRIVAEFFACSPNYRSFEWRAKNRGYLSWFLEQGLRGQAASGQSGEVSLDALKRYLATAVPAAVRDNEFGKDQIPTGDIIGPLDAGDFVVARPPRPTPALAVPPVVTPIDTYAHLTVNVNVRNATVLFDGQPVTPGQEASIDLGLDKSRQVEIGVAADGYQALRQQVLLAAGTHATLQVTLAPLASSNLPSSRNKKPLPPNTRPPRSVGPMSGSLRINEKDNAVMVYVDAGTFLMGDIGMADNPRHMVTLSAYYIYKNLVTVAMFRTFCDSNEAKAKHIHMPNPPGGDWQDDHPIVNVSWDDAAAYCDWAGGRLPTEAEWEKAARGTDSRKYPWGDRFDQSRLWCSSKTDSDAGGTHAVGSFPSGASPYGALDMAGNVEEWCEDFYIEDFMSSRRAKEANPVNEVPSQARVLRGGSWSSCDAIFFRTANRGQSAPSFGDGNKGFRVVVVAGRH